MMAPLILLLAAFLAVLVDGDQLFDVTTIYNIIELESLQDSDDASPFSGEIAGRIHSRTNSLGLKLQNTDGESVSANREINITFDSSESECNWSMKGWNFVYSDVVWKAIESNIYPIKNNKLRIKFPSTNGKYKFNCLFLMPSKSSIREQTNFYLLQFDNYRQNSYYFYYDCETTTNGGDFLVEDQNGIPVAVTCSHYTSISPSSEEEVLSFDFDSRIRIFSKNSIDPIMDWDRDNDIRYFSMSKDLLIHNPLLAQLILESRENGSEFVSPAFNTESRKLCLVVVAFTPSDFRGNLLNILALDFNQVEHLLDTISLKEGWNVKHINSNLQNMVFGPINIKIRKIGSAQVNIRYISSCSSDGEEVEVFSMPKSYLPSSASSYSVDSDIIASTEKITNMTNYCLNGGILTTAGCDCPPGFSGFNCRVGCGKNRFGMDCEGLCSLRNQECEGLMMCTQFTKCRCAPGYNGPYCQEHCSPGTYGNECLQTCGKCVSSSPCDIYSGECTACEPGYIPPYCAQASVYYSLKPELKSEDYGALKVSFYSQRGVSGFGVPKLYQIQYREKNDVDWKVYTSEFMPSPNDMATQDTQDILDHKNTETIHGLKIGVFYQVRVLLMDASFNKYTGDEVQVSEALTKCDIPEEYDYKTTAVSNTSSFKFSWRYANTSEHWCPVELFEVSWKEDWKWRNEQIFDESFTLNNFLPGSTINFKVRAKTSGGLAPYSKTITASTLHSGSHPVKDLRMVSAQSSAVEISWRPPHGSETRKLQYKVIYKCVEQLACSPGCDNASEGELTQEGTTVTLSSLLPFTQYSVTVSPVDGPDCRIVVGTTEVEPTEVPKSGTQNPIRTNTSLTVFWEPVPICSSFLQGYNYQLSKVSDSLKVLASGFTKDTTVSFHNLSASTEYVVKVFILTIAGWNPDNYLAIKSSTSATVPEAVRNLTVYKRGRNMLGLRWAEPKALYGQLKSFSVKVVLGNDVKVEIIEPSPCTVWPELYCHTILGLKSNRKYNVSVSARNADMPEDGAEAVVFGMTKESAPTAPENLAIINTSSSSITLQWQHPNLTNGVLRSFLVNVEETEKFDQDSCCQVYPLLETSVKEEERTYHTEVSGLHPASTYYVTVTAKTVGLGPSQSLVVYTKPPHISLTLLPSQEITEEFTLSEVTWKPQDYQYNNSDVFSPLIKAHLILAVPDVAQQGKLKDFAKSGIYDSHLMHTILGHTMTPVFFCGEYNEAGELVTDSTWGHPTTSLFSTGLKYQLIAAQVTEYNGVHNVDLRYSSTFTYQ